MTDTRTKFEKVRDCFNAGWWDTDRVRNAVLMGWINEMEFMLITGEDYAAGGGENAE